MSLWSSCYRNDQGISSKYPNPTPACAGQRQVVLHMSRSSPLPHSQASASFLLRRPWSNECMIAHGATAAVECVFERLRGCYENGAGAVSCPPFRIKTISVPDIIATEIVACAVEQCGYIGRQIGSTYPISLTEELMSLAWQYRARRGHA